MVNIDASGKQTVIFAAIQATLALLKQPL